MAAASRRSSGPVLRTLSPAGRFRSSRPPPATTAFASSTSTFSARSTAFFQNRSGSPTRDSLYGSSSGSVLSVRFGSISPNRSISVAGAGRQSHHQKRTCMCSPTSHPGSFRCSLHKSFGSRSAVSAAPASNRLNARRSAMTNSLVRIRGVEGELVKRALAALIRPSSHQQRRRGDFRPRPSRLSVMFTAKD
ncbi:hypothetical protein AAZX31_09G086500 [Glycine max]|uniref:Serine-rich protein n=2 Tax=Glycine subgen. Soja TaxID=1462606 RepID=I1L290_SOYBN|nr:uncharacterized protein LOC100794542 [Glycine max]XP_028248363.1 uncharacterized protein LOC114425626 [Glycine soja]KAG4924432.1 hypothetical protein JHK87_049972 [Glycine soja]KAG5012331.1 hypothetical protein JHK86_024592 [Glycine max]KAH1042222.1 hypothetical protein GYH30_024506 [Glycine max]KAH1232709.1 hypothetical protein GmHk_09G025296 [Glycine max]KRH37826.1 hypothetical protein GLYMA_09G092100v4 [Glycine max]|eukprot:XP_003533861.1 uncharacterized protein LOC100794542 [Glycine max]